MKYIQVSQLNEDTLPTCWECNLPTETRQAVSVYRQGRVWTGWEK